MRVALADPPEESLTLVELSETVGPRGETDVERFTVPAKPLMLEAVIVEVTFAPVTVVMTDGEADRVKSVVDDVETILARGWNSWLPEESMWKNPLALTVSPCFTHTLGSTVPL